MACSNCFNGCAEITSDKCVKYTGIDYPALGISNGDTLCSVEESISNFLLTVISGEGITPEIATDTCTLISDLFAEYPNPTLVDILTILVRASCNLQDQITTLNNTVVFEADYTIECLTGVLPSSGTHDILQAVITKLCAVDASLTSLVNTVFPNTYVAIEDINDIIQNYIDSQAPSSAMINKMVPYVAYEFYGTLAGKFDANGVGLAGTDWEKVYICNGFSGLTPDKRGRIAIGATAGPGTAITDPVVNPLVAGNPNYSAGVWGAWTKQGANTVTLDVSQMPSHAHSNSSMANQVGHYHHEFSSLRSEPQSDVLADSYAAAYDSWDGNYSYRVSAADLVPTLGKTSTVTPAVNVSVTINNAGGGLSHPNIPPVMACYYIMYIP